jgi:ABC-type multidrug transport system permease subunit
MTAVAHLAPHGVTVHRPGALSLLRDQVGYATRAMWRSRIVLVFTFVLPLVWLAVIGLMAGNAAVDESTGVRVMQFATPMAAVLGLLLSAYPPVAYSLALAREQKIMKRLQGTPLPMWAYLLGRVGAAVALSAAAVVAMLAVGVVAYGIQIQVQTLAATIVTFAFGIACLAALGLAVGALAPSGSTAQTFAIASAMVVAFLSGLMTFGLTPPGWMDAVGSLFPVRYLLEPLRSQFNPFLDGSGWDVTALGMLAAWCAGAIVVAAWALRREPASKGPSIVPATATGAREIRVGEAARPSAMSLVLDQVRWATTAALRDFGWVFFAIAMPVGLYALMAMQLTDAEFRPRGMAFAVYFAVGMAAYGASITAFINMPEAVAVGRDRGVLKRLRGTPLAPWHYLAGRTTSVLWIAFVTAVLVFAAGVLFFGVELSPESVPLGAAVLLFGTLSLAACGYALVAILPSGRAIGVVGLALLLPLAFISDVFPFGGTMPEWLTAIASAFPLIHFVHALAGALDPGETSLEWLDLAVLGAWLVGATLVALRWFRWEPKR